MAPEPEYVVPPGLHNGPIVLADSDERWPVQYDDVERRVRDALGERARAVHHVGSTSVAGLAAKPIIDVVLVVADSADESGYVPDLTRAGFAVHLREPDWHEHRLLKGTDPAVNLHVFGVGASEVSRMLAFRDHLRSNSVARDRYLAVKRRLATQTWSRVQDYADAKSEIVEELIAEAGKSS